MGNVAVFFNIIDISTKYVHSVDTEGIGCVCIHPSKTKFALAGKGHKPRILIYSYPDMKVRIQSDIIYLYAFNRQSIIGSKRAKCGR